MQSLKTNKAGLAEVLAVAKGLVTPPKSEAEAKLLNFLLREGECTAAITNTMITVWYSWLDNWRPATYPLSLAPAVVGGLMQLGSVERLDDEATFQVGPGTTGTGRYVFDFSEKWVRIRWESEQMLIHIREERKGLDEEDTQKLRKVTRCERCNGLLRTPRAKQCFNCGHDWH